MRTKGVRPRQGFAVEGRCEALEGRELLSAATAQVAMLGATTLDSKGVTVTYGTTRLRLAGSGDSRP